MTAQKSFPMQSLKMALLASLSATSLSLQVAQAQTPTLTGQTASGLARVYTSQTVGQLPNGMIAITLPTQVMVNGAVQILMPDYRVITVPAGSYSVQSGTVYAQPNVLQSIGYPVPAEFLVTNTFASNGLQPGATTSIAPRKVLGFIPEAGTSFDTSNQDPAFGTRGLRVTRFECQAATNGTMASLSGDVAFDTNQAVIKPQAQGTLNNLARQMMGVAGATFTITGHTDSRGSEGYNRSLSESRARAVVEYLANQGVPRTSLSAVGAGESRPIASNDTDAGRAQNRRVEVTSSGGPVQTASQNCERVEVLEPSASGSFTTTPGFSQQITTLQPAPDPFLTTGFDQPQPPTFDASTTFIDGSGNFGAGGFGTGPAAVALGPATPGVGQFAVAPDPFAAQAPVPTFAPQAPTFAPNQPIPVESLPGFAEANAAAEADQGLFGGIQQSLSDVPPIVWGLASFAAVAGGYLLLVGAGDDAEAE